MPKHSEHNCSCYCCANDIKLLLESGDWLAACGSTPCSWGTSPLHWALLNGSLEAVELLVEGGHSLEVGGLRVACAALPQRCSVSAESVAR